MHRPLPKLVALLLVAAFLLPACRKKEQATGDEFLRWSNVGKAHLDRAEAEPALAAFEKALALNPNHPDAKLNLANACLLTDNAARAASLAASALEQEPANPVAHYVLGVAALRQRDYTNAIKFLQQTKDIDIRVNAVSMQLGFAYEGLGKFEEALAQYEEIAQFEPDFPGVHFRQSQMLQRLGRGADAAVQLQAHQQWLAKNPSANLTPAALERCVYTAARVPFQLEQPDTNGISVVFTDVSAEVLPPPSSGRFDGPVGVIDFARDGTNHLLVRHQGSFRVLRNHGGKFTTSEQSFPFTNGGDYSRWLVADLNKDAVPDALVLGENGVHLFRFTTNGTATETTAFAGLRNLSALDGLFVDLNFRGDLDLVTINTNYELRVMSNLQNMYFVDSSTNTPALTKVDQLAAEDWNNDETQDLFVMQEGVGVAGWLKERGGAWSTNGLSFPLSNQAPATPFAIGDMDNDLRPDLVRANFGTLSINFNGSETPIQIIRDDRLSTRAFSIESLKLVDYDNDGWLDIFAVGRGLRLFRNLGAQGFRDVTEATGLNKITNNFTSFAAADLDNDCDTDIAVGTRNRGIYILRNEGGNKNHQLRIALQGTRSNSSGIGVRVDVVAGGLRTSRRVQELPIEIGVGKHNTLDAVNAHWFELSPSYTEIALTNCEPLRILELSLPTGSCPYLYSEDGDHTRFVSDLLCSAPLGLPIAPGKYIQADEDEIAWVGNEQSFRPKITTRQGTTRPASNFVLRITEELREVLYLDEAKLLVVDHPAGTEVHSTTKMLPGKSSSGFGKHELITLHRRLPLRAAVNDQGVEVTELVSEIDRRFASPSKLRESQLRGLAEPHSVTVDFGALPTDKPLVLALTGWLRFGGGMANIAASSYDQFPFPFPTLESEVNGQWQRVNVELGAPSGRAKTILADLTGKLPSGTRRLRINAAFEIHWDRIALFERADENQTTITRVAPTRTDLHWRGYSQMVEVGRSSSVGQATGTPLPIVPDYAHTTATPLWRLTPSGWATRYGAVDELLAARDNALVLVCGGDELSLEFGADQLPPKAPGAQRDFLVFVSGWDKDSDFHVASGTTIAPLPWHGLNDQTYSSDARPTFTNDAWIQKYNTRWVGERIMARRPVK